MKLDSNIFSRVDIALNASFEGGHGISARPSNVIDLSSIFGGAAPQTETRPTISLGGFHI